MALGIWLHPLVHVVLSRSQGLIYSRLKSIIESIGRPFHWDVRKTPQTPDPGQRVKITAILLFPLFEITVCNNTYLDESSSIFAGVNHLLAPNAAVKSLLSSVPAAPS